MGRDIGQAFSQNSPERASAHPLSYALAWCVHRLRVCREKRVTGRLGSERHVPSKIRCTDMRLTLVSTKILIQSMNEISP